jgi:hypothetical protein
MLFQLHSVSFEWRIIMALDSLCWLSTGLWSTLYNNCRTWKHKSASLQSAINNANTLLLVVGGVPSYKRKSDTRVCYRLSRMAKTCMYKYVLFCRDKFCSAGYLLWMGIGLRWIMKRKDKCEADSSGLGKESTEEPCEHSNWFFIFRWPFILV